MRESFGENWKKAFAEGDEIIPTDLDAPIPEFLRTPTSSGPIVIKRDEVSRREVLQKGVSTGMAVAVGIAGAGLLKHIPTSKETKAQEPERSKNKEEKDVKDIETSNRTIVIPTGNMAGRKVGDLFAFYLGLPPSTDKKPTFVPKELTVNFGQVLEDLWDKKIALVAKKKSENDLWIANMKNQGRDIFHGEYQKKWDSGDIESLSIPDVIKKADTIISELNEALSWSELNTLKWKDEEGNGYAPFESLNDTAVKVVKDIAGEITGHMIMAYSITELMPSLNDGNENVDEYELLLKYAGTEFLNGAPALGDPYLSTGPFQFTSFAVFSAGGERRGASIINMLLPKEMRIPGSVSKLTTMDNQIKAAHLFAIHNIALLVKRILDDSNKPRAHERLITFIENKDHQAAILQYIASAHHAPGHAIPAFKAWLDVGMKGSHAAHAKREMPKYIKKSYINFKALQTRYPAK